MISVRPIAPHEWPKYRDIRLRALRDAPDAFGSSYAAEAAIADEDWSARIAAAAASDGVFFALNDEQVCGLVWCKQSAANPGRADLYQMWVAPNARKQGAGHALLDAALDWARSAGIRSVHLGVTAANSAAMRLYLSHGFRAIGPLEPLRAGSPLMAQAMELELA